ncbi:TM0106 family RecB-like putative nuclease [Pseudothermotoga sp. U03pept]|uniref:TM0106 family RecB-like putative nuclease n=1 Tax=Pseudothermotoga sp. U03pept TaxID=3447012 RepID=UPI003F033CCB
MNESLWFDDLEQFLICPRRYYLEREEITSKWEKTVFEQETKDMMKAGFSVEKPVIAVELFGKTLISDPQLVVPDGDRWKIVLKKSAKHFKNKYYLEAAFHGYVFSSAGFIVSQVIIDTPYFVKEIDWRDGLTRLFSVIESIVQLRMNDPPDPKPISQCKSCQYVLNCTELLVQKKDLLAIHGLNEKTRLKLIENGIGNLLDLAHSEDIKDISKESFEKMKKKAISLLDKREVILSEYEELSNGVFLDIESHTLREFDYLFGVLVDDKYVPFLSENENEEYKVFTSLLEFLDQTDGPIYHYCPYEPSRFSSLIQQWTDLKPLGEKIKRRFVDLYQILTKHVALPLFTYSLKSVARFYGFNWRTKLDGLKASRYFQLWLNTHDDSYLKVVLDYNEDDTRATKVVLEKLNILRNQ